MPNHGKSPVLIKSALDVVLPTATAEQHKLELERVTPQLLAKINLVNDNKDWRLHLQQTQHYYEQLKAFDKKQAEEDVRRSTGRIGSAQPPSIKTQLATIAGEIEKGLEKISSREKYINTQFENQTEEFRVLQDHLSSLKQKQQDSTSNLTQLSNELSRASEELDMLKVNHEMSYN